MKQSQFYVLLLIFNAGCQEAKNIELAGRTAEWAENSEIDNKQIKEEKTSPEFQPDNFISDVSNPFFSLSPGRKYFYDGVSADGVKIHKEILATDQKREIAGVEAFATWSREWHDGSLVSDAKDWFAQDESGNVWHLGQQELNIFGGYLKSRGREWFAEENNAKAGIFIPGAPKVGEEFAVSFNGSDQEKAEVLAVGENFPRIRGQLNNCLKIGNYILGDHPRQFQRYYCKDVGNFSAELIPDSFGKVELTRIEDNHSSASMNISYPELKINFNEEQAKKNALDKVSNSDSVKSIELTLKDDEPAYAIDVLDKDNEVTRVFLDIVRGRFLSLEKLD
ncbi:MAG: hypothetical protein KC505_07210 [Myxococcales bacterium]|nr:hypothetical protein [Myxococcales bacterium]USN50106.1 MAG: hypothetical protein H6731_07490 [Myxococcales bacterium]